MDPNWRTRFDSPLLHIKPVSELGSITALSDPPTHRGLVMGRGRLWQLSVVAVEGGREGLDGGDSEGTPFVSPAWPRPAAAATSSSLLLCDTSGGLGSGA